MKLKGSQAIIKVLLEQGVDTVFGYPGGQVIPLYDALYDAPLKNVLTAHEQGAIHAADGYARASGKTGVCIATSGPGATNIVTGLATAYLDSVPLVAITGQVPVSNLGRDSFQEIDIVGVTVPITKYNVLVRRSEDLVPALRKAFAIAKEGRPGPVLVDVPSNLQVAELEWQEAEPEITAENPQADAISLAEAAALLNKAQQPVLLVGGGALNSNAGTELVELAIKADLPIVNTLMGVGVVPASNERSLGMTGMHGHIASNMAVVNADVLVVAGSRFSERVTGDRTRYVGKKTIIQLDIDPSEIDKNIAVSVPVVGDIKESLQKLLPLIKEAKHEAWWQQVKAWDATEDRSLEKGDRLTAPWLMKHLSAAMDKDTVFVTDVGQNQMWAAQHLIVDKPRHHLTSGGCGTMGFGLPAALGTAFAVNSPVVHICGDGGFKMTGMELYTACREHKKIISIVINNSCLGMVRQWQHIFYNARYSSTILSEFDFIGFARSCGADGVRAATCEEFAQALEMAKKTDKPFLIEAFIQQGDIVEPMVAPGAVLDDFVKVSK
ncbi:biosynthetic-type acetolactate synthase large subunit [uncultured Phascolarctobacterium sp.]|uniref:biosynthetic-type acetolactate synthase large subunit n=1 Tax=uncultured Phascolarctobacterium sp. TaxID=512296 RepID=UPI0026139B16|nr:biosynthetic-type acetolactate synthase large subunit [uncultured Phascolarctobacterium sp.]